MLGKFKLMALEPILKDAGAYWPGSFSEMFYAFPSKSKLKGSPEPHKIIYRGPVILTMIGYRDGTGKNLAVQGNMDLPEDILYREEVAEKIAKQNKVFYDVVFTHSGLINNIAYADRVIHRIMKAQNDIIAFGEKASEEFEEYFSRVDSIRIEE